MKRIQVITSQVLPVTCAGAPANVPVLRNFIGGDFVPVNVNSCVAVTNPLTGEVLANVPESGRPEVDAAVQAAAQAWPAWSTTPAKARVEVLFRFKELMEAHLAELTELVVREHGKNRGEAEAEVMKGIETIAFATGLPDLLAGRKLEVSRGVTCEEFRRPLGVVVSIVPFNFPAMVPLWTLPIAIGCGNCLIIKPSEKAPLTLMRMAELLQKAGCPKGVFSLVHGTQGAVEALARHPGIAAVSFVGSSRVAKIVDDTARATGKRALCMGGAKNHLIVMPDADEVMTIEDIMNSAFGSAGQRCMAASVLLVVGKQRQSFLEALVKRASQMKPGQAAGEVGPLIDAAAKSRVVRYIDECVKHGGQILLDGREWSTRPNLSKGFFVGPTVLLHKSTSEPSMQDEIFGPVLSVFAVDSLEEAIAIENSNPYGNAAAIYTTSGQTALAASRLSAGMLGINIGVPVPREPFSFGGIRQSKFGDCSDITGAGSINFWTEVVKVTTKWQPSKQTDAISRSFIS